MCYNMQGSPPGSAQGTGTRSHYCHYRTHLFNDNLYIKKNYLENNIYQVYICPPQYGLYSFRAQNKVDALVLLTLALAGASPTCILHEGIHTP